MNGTLTDTDTTWTGSRFGIYMVHTTGIEGMMKDGSLIHQSCEQAVALGHLLAHQQPSG